MISSMILWEEKIRLITDKACNAEIFVIQKQPHCYNALNFLICTKMFTNTVALQSKAKEGFSAQFYALIQQNAEAQA